MIPIVLEDWRGFSIILSNLTVHASEAVLLSGAAGG